MASATGPPAAVTSELPQQPSHPTQHANTTATADDLDVPEDQSAEAPVKSLFGPFPPSLQNSEPTQPTPSTVPQSTDRIETSQIQDDPQSTHTQTFIPSGDGSSEPIQLNQISHVEKSSLPPLTREKTAPAIGPATDKPTPLPKAADTDGPVLFITLLLSSTGARHPYRLDEKYLRKRNVAVDGNNPINISLYKLKELILRDWREGEEDLSYDMSLGWNLE